MICMFVLSTFVCAKCLYCTCVFSLWVYALHACVFIMCLFECVLYLCVFSVGVAVLIACLLTAWIVCVCWVHGNMIIPCQAQRSCLKLTFSRYLCGLYSWHTTSEGRTLLKRLLEYGHGTMLKPPPLFPPHVMGTMVKWLY